jgi:serine/threonine protein kinase
LLKGLLDLKKLKIVHRDIKPENIIVSTELESIKLVDFGLATRTDEPSYIFVRCGTPGFIAPEILKIKDLATVRLGVESDMFSLGAIYYRILYGKSLFGGKEQVEVLHNNRLCQIRLA